MPHCQLALPPRSSAVSHGVSSAVSHGVSSAVSYGVSSPKSSRTIMLPHTIPESQLQGRLQTVGPAA